VIRDVVIIKDGIPLLSNSYSDSPDRRASIFSNQDNLIMVSGFFSALNSFSNQFDDLGSISELRFDSRNNDLKLSFLKDNQIPNLIYLASFDDKSLGVNVQRYLRKISNTFLNKYSIEQINKWSGRMDYFDAFEEEVKKYVDDEKKETEGQFKEKVIDLFNSVEKKINENTKDYKTNASTNLKEEGSKENQCLKCGDYVPCFKVAKKINPRHYLSGEASYKVFNQIDGKKSINQISSELKLNPEGVYNICKILIKFGFVSLVNS